MITLLILGLLIMLLADGYVSSARAVLTRFHLNRQLQSITQDFRKGETIRKLLDHFSRVDTSLTLSQMISRLAAVGLFLAVFWFEKPAVWSWPVIFSLFGLALIITALEWGASLMVLKSPASWMGRTAGLVNGIYQALKPFTFLLFIFTRDIEASQKKLSQVSEEDLKTLVDESHKDGLLEEEEQKMIHSVFRLDDTLTREIMVPRIDMEAIDAQVHFSKAVNRFVDSGFSRIPVYQHNVDNIIGLLYAKDLLEICGNGDHQGSIAELVRPAYFVPESKVINELLADMQKKRVHLAIVVDECFRYCYPGGHHRGNIWRYSG
jgi:putative hemolysin